MTLHIVRIAGLIALLVVCTFYPVLPGGYDPLAVSLSAMAQTLGMVGLLVTPVGIAWLVSELQKRTHLKRNLAARGYYFALASIITASIVAVAALFAELINGGLAFAVLPLVVFCYIGSRLIPKLKLLKKSEVEDFNPAPLYLVFIPVIVLGFQLILAPRATNVSKYRAIAKR